MLVCAGTAGLALPNRPEEPAAVVVAATVVEDAAGAALDTAGVAVVGLTPPNKPPAVPVVDGAAAAVVAAGAADFAPKSPPTAGVAVAAGAPEEAVAPPKSPLELGAAVTVAAAPGVDVSEPAAGFAPNREVPTAGAAAADCVAVAEPPRNGEDEPAVDAGFAPLKRPPLGAACWPPNNPAEAGAVVAAVVVA